MIIYGKKSAYLSKKLFKKVFFLENIEIEPGSFSVCVWFPAGVFWHSSDAEVRET